MPAGKRKKPSSDAVLKSRFPSDGGQRRSDRRITIACVEDGNAQRPRKRRKSQTTMTQLDLGRRSFLEVIADSDEEIRSSDDDAHYQLRKPKRMNRRTKPARTESQTTLTQFTTRSSHDLRTVISDSEDDGVSLSDVEPINKDAALENIEALPMVEASTRTTVQSIQHYVQAANESVITSLEAKHQPVDLHDRALYRTSTPRRTIRGLRTPTTIRTLPVPSSRSPPDTMLSTQVTPRNIRRPEYRSPLQERSANPQQALVFDQKGINLQLSPLSATIPRRRTDELSDSPTKRKVRDFNTRLAILEQENTKGARGRYTTRFNAMHPTATLSRCPDIMFNVLDNVDTQYTTSGCETQEACWRLAEVTVNGTTSMKRQVTPEIVKSSRPAVRSAGTRTAQPLSSHPERLMSPTVLAEALDADANEEGGRRKQEILIPSSQNRGFAKTIELRKLSNDTTHPSVDPLVTDDAPLESVSDGMAYTYLINTKDTQDLASNQLLRETQDAFVHRVPSSPLLREPSSSSYTRARVPRSKPFVQSSQTHPSQASTVDDAVTSSSVGPERRTKNPSQLNPTLDLRILGSSALQTRRLEEDCIVVESSPPAQPPYPMNSPSSPMLPEPQTPNILKNLKTPLLLNDLVSDSLTQGYTIPPSWQGDHADSDEDDGEL